VSAVHQNDHLHNLNEITLIFQVSSIQFEMGAQQFPEWSEKLVKLYGIVLKMSVYQNVQIPCGTKLQQTIGEYKHTVFWDVVPCGFIINRRFGGTCPLHLQGGRNNRNTFPCSRYFFYTLDGGDTFIRDIGT
jgi:hypothetical protein